MKNIQNLCKVSKKFNFNNSDPDESFGLEKEILKTELNDLLAKLSELQQKLYAEGRRSVLIVLQGTDTSGKDGVIRHVMRAFNPIGCRVASFKTPNNEEISHDFLWRIHKKIPPKGIIGVFNRSHYEDIIEVRVRKLLPKETWIKRYRQINEFERYLTEDNITVIKFLLNISKEEQYKRLMDRISDPTEKWKASSDDYEKRKKWDEYHRAYSDVVAESSTKYAPWYIIPSNKKWIRNWVIAKILVERLEKMNPKFPDVKIDINIKM